MDWSKTAVGPIETWPEALKTAVRICLGSRHPIVIWWGRSELTQIYNDGYIPILGVTKHPGWLGRSGRECWSEIWPVMGPMFESVFRTGESNWSEDFLFVLNRNLPREEAYFTFSYGAVPDDSGKVAGIFCACNETTGRVIGERRLRTLRDLGRKVITANTAEDACVLAANTLAGNPSDIPFALIYLLDEGGQKARLCGTTGLDAGGPASPDEIDPGGTDAAWPLATVLDTNGPVLLDDLSKRHGPLPAGPWPESSESALMLPLAGPGRTRPVGFLIAGLSPRRVIDADYRSFCELVAGHVSTALANARAYEEERERAEALAAIDRAKTVFFSNISHEFRTPLTLMLGPLENLLSKQDGVSPEVREEVATAHRNSLRLLKLVNSLLDFSRIEAGRIRARYEATDLGVLTAELASNFRSAIEAAGLTLSVECPPLPQPVYVDRDMWEKIVLNLLSNAFKFTFAGGITVRLEARGDAAVLTVADTGTGIPNEELPHVFQRFHRIENARGRSFEGSGIGLALIAEYVKLHGGSVDARSRLDEGSTFTVTVPFGHAHLPKERLAATNPGIQAARAGRVEAFTTEAWTWLGAEDNQLGGHPEPRGTRGRILLADDNADMREHIIRVLGDAYDVRTVSDGRAALDAAREHKPDLILSDVMMPVLDGIGMLRELRGDPELRQVPVILVSARAGEEARTEGINAGADDYLTKPFSANELIARVHTTLRLEMLRREARSEVEAASAQLISALEAARMVTWEWDCDSGRITFSPNAPEVFGLPVELDLQRAMSTVDPRDIAPLRAVLDDAIARRGPFSIQHRFRRTDNGEMLWMELRGDTCSLSPLRFRGVSLDITDLRRAHEALRQSEERLTLAVQGAGMGTWDVDLSTGRSPWSQKHYEMLGYPPEANGDATLEMWLARIHSEDRAAVESDIERARAGGQYASEHRIIRADNNEVRWLSEFGQVVRDSAGELYRFVGVSFDITGRKQAEQDLRRANQDLEQFAYSASHDLQEPLRTVKIFSELLLTRYLDKLDGEARDFLRNVRGGATRMESLVRDLLAYTQVGTFEQPVSLEDAGAALQAALANLSGAVAECGAKVNAGELPRLPAHAAHLQQLFMNLVGNAIKYRRPEVDLVVGISAELQNGYWQFAVSDNGIGIEPEFKDRIFGLFKRLHTSDAYTGTGIGLSLCQRIVERYHGRIWVESTPGEGSTFYFTLPA